MYFDADGISEGVKTLLEDYKLLIVFYDGSYESLIGLEMGHS